jgi:hypothetical protein
MMTALVACLAALSTGIGPDKQKPFAIVIVAGSMNSTAIFWMPAGYEPCIIPFMWRLGIPV